MTDAPQPELNPIELVALAARARARVERVEIGGRAVWVKCARAKSIHPGHYAQWLGALLTPDPIFRPAPPERGDAASRGEAARLRAFAAGGFAVPDILFEGKGVLVLSDCGRNLLDLLNGLRAADDAQAHDDLLTLFVVCLGKAHAAGLVHGRPHPRDMFLRGHEIGYLDFEQDPLAVMDLDRARARDALYAFGFLCDMAMRPDTADRAFAAWCATVPASTRDRLTRTIRLMRPLIAAGNLLAGVKLGADLRRFLAGTRYLARAVSQEPARPADDTGTPRPDEIGTPK